MNKDKLNFYRPATAAEIYLQHKKGFGCKLVPQRNKVPKKGADPCLIDEEKNIVCPIDCNATGVVLATLPDFVAILDIDEAWLSQAVLSWLNDPEMHKQPHNLGVVETQRGIHIYGLIRPENLGALARSKIVLLRCCAEAELCTNKLKGHNTVFGPHKTVLTFPSIDEELGYFPSFLQPIPHSQFWNPANNLTGPILQGTRWNTLDKLVREAIFLDEETLEFLGLFVCSPPFEDLKMRDLRTILAGIQAQRAGSQIEPKFSLEWQVATEIKAKLKGTLNYYASKGIWFKRTNEFWDELRFSEEVLGIIRDFIQESPAFSNRRETSTRNFYQKVEGHLRLVLDEPFIEPTGPLLSNGVLEKSPDGHFFVREPKEMELFTCRSPFAYNPEAKLSLEMAKFLCHFCDGSLLKLNVLRIWLSGLFRFDQSLQIALALEGVGAAGKSLLANLIAETLTGRSSKTGSFYSKGGVVEMELNRLSNRFETHKIGEAHLVIFPDATINRLTKEVAGILKRLITHDPIYAKVKYGVPYSFTPKCYLLFHSNDRWLSNDQTSGFRRRFLYLEATRTTLVPDPHLFEKLRPDLDGFFNWAINSPISSATLSQNVEGIMAVQGGLSTDVMREWIVTTLSPNPKGSIVLGIKGTIAKDEWGQKTLWPSYVEFCDQQDYQCCESYEFSALLIDQLRALGCRDVKKVRKSQGYWLSGISFQEQYYAPFPQIKRLGLPELLETDPFKGWIANDPDLGVLSLAELIDDSESSLT